MMLPEFIKQELIAADEAEKLETLPPLTELQNELTAAAQHVTSRVLPLYVRGIFGISRQNRVSDTGIYPVHFGENETLLSSIHSTYLDLHRINGYVGPDEELTLEHFLRFDLHTSRNHVKSYFVGDPHLSEHAIIVKNRRISAASLLCETGGKIGNRHIFNPVTETYRRREIIPVISRIALAAPQLPENCLFLPPEPFGTH